MSKISTVLLVLHGVKKLSIYPSVYQCANELKKRDFRVCLVTSIKCDDEKVAALFDEIYFIEPSSDKYYSLYCYSSFIVNTKPEYVICFEPQDAINASIATIFHPNCSYIYYNLEIFGSYPHEILELYGREKSAKIFEQLYCQNSICLVIQDELREYISAGYGITHEKVFHIPNSYYNENLLPHNNAPDTAKVIYSGGRLPKNIIGQAADILNGCSSFSLTFAGWSFTGVYTNTEKDALRAKGINIFENDFDSEQYSNLIREYDIGFVWHLERGDNNYFMGRSSGKLYKYLSCGKPVIVKNFPGVADDVKKYKLGVVINELTELEQAVREIKNNYAMYADNISKAAKIFDYGAVSKDFFDYLASLRQKSKNHLPSARIGQKESILSNTQLHHLIKIFEKIDLPDMLKRIKEKKFFIECRKISRKKIIFFGSGSGAKSILKDFPLHVEYIVDNNHERWGENVDDVPIYSPEKLYEENKDRLIIFIVTRHYQEISRQLTEMGFVENIHFKDGVDIFLDLFL